MNPLYVLLMAAAVGLSGLAEGYHLGSDHRAVVDQAQFDKINASLTKQKADASAQLQAISAEHLKDVADRDATKHQLETTLVQANQDRDALAARYFSLSLRYRAAQGPGSGSGGASAQGAQAVAVGTAEAPGEIVQLPDRVAGDLRSLARQADGVLDAYRACYDDEQQR